MTYTDATALPNICEIKFHCPAIPFVAGREPENCVYYQRSDKTPDYCRHDPDCCGNCRSAVARVNACVLFLKKYGIKTGTQAAD